MAPGVADRLEEEAAQLADVTDGTVRAAGGLVWRPRPSGDAEVLIVHRPKYEDWTLPKGKCADGEGDEACALREVEEETGLRCELGVDLGATEYTDRHGRPKRVHYWAMRAADGAFRPNDEVDDVRWLPVDDARSELSYDLDRAIVDRWLRCR